MVLNPQAPKRHGAAMVEMTFVSLIFFMFLFGIVEYCRFLYVQQVITNACREGARFAIVHTNIDDPDTTDDEFVVQTREIVERKLVGLQNGLENYALTIYRVDLQGNKVYLLDENGDVVQENGDDVLAPANDAEFGEFIVVEITGDFEPILPSLLLMGNRIPISGKAFMNSEAN
ncbi:MAG: TadE/TadG family type IV pilus assembly protein [Gemmataceae bacterium]